jgi:hypothetical protein
MFTPSSEELNRQYHLVLLLIDPRRSLAAHGGPAVPFTHQQVEEAATFFRNPAPGELNRLRMCYTTAVIFPYTRSWLPEVELQGLDNANISVPQPAETPLAPGDGIPQHQSPVFNAGTGYPQPANSPVSSGQYLPPALF